MSKRVRPCGVNVNRGVTSDSVYVVSAPYNRQINRILIRIEKKKEGIGSTIVVVSVVIVVVVVRGCD